MFTPDTVATNPPVVYFFHTDHLETPRVVTDAVGNLRWRWLAEPFGTTAPETNPSGLGAFTQPLRFPGQYADQESGLSYNYFRNYDSSIGRYNSSDPIGLNGGINTYAYVYENPLSFVDPLGLDVLVCFYAGGVTHVGFGDGNSNDRATWGFYPKKHEPFGPGVVKPDTGHEKQECTVLPATPKQDECMQQCRSDREANPGRYNIATRQCTSYVRECLAQCGLPSGAFGPGPEPWYRSLPGATPYPASPQN